MQDNRSGRGWTLAALLSAFWMSSWGIEQAAAEPATAATPAIEAAVADHSTELHATVRSAVAELADPEGASGLLPAGTAVDRVAWEGSVVAIDLTFPDSAAEREFPISQVEEIVARLARAVRPDLNFGGVKVHARVEGDEHYRLLEEFVPAVSPGEYPPLAEDAAVAPGAGAVEPAAHDRAGPVVNAGHQPAGALSGVTIFAAAGHGWTAGSSSWFLQRPLLLDMIEDYGNLEQLNYFVQYCFNAGATVVPFRPVGYQNVEIVLDQDDPGVTYTGAWTDSTGSPNYENGATVSGVSYRFASANVTETATARYTPTIPSAAFYPVYTWALDSTNRTTQKYRITHSGGTTEVVVDHRLVGKGWVWLGDYYFEAGTGGFVEISNQSAAGGVVIADAIRFGNGIGDVVGAGPGTVSGHPRDEEAQRYWAESETDINANGLPTSIYNCCSLDSDDNVGTGARWAREMNNSAFNNDRWRRVYLEFHSNASSGSARGTVALITGSATTNQAVYAQILGEEIENDLLVLDADFEYTWGIRNPNTFSGAYGAISTSNNDNEFDATILEVAFHDNSQDAALLLDPKVRDAVARSSVHGLIKFLNGLAGSTVPLAFPPAPPRDVRAQHDGAGGVVVAWTAPLTGDAYGDAPTGYRVYRSTNGFGFDGGTDVGNVLSTTLIDVPAGTATYIRVAAYNAGGESMPTETVGVRRSADETSTFLIVNGFDRVGRSQDPTQVISGLGTQRRPIWRKVNSFDYVVQHGQALAAGGATFDACANEAVINGDVLLDDYRAVVWICGEESTADDTFNATEQTLVTAFLNGGGKLFVSGSEIGWDLDAQGNGVSFYNNQLKADYAADDAATYSVSAVPASIFDGISPFAFDNGTLYYDVEWPDVLAAFGGSAGAMSYVGGTGGTAGVVYDGAFQVVNLGFPFETITSSAPREQIMDRIIGFFFPGPFDADRDGDVDLTDCVDFESCLQGPEVAYSPGDSCLVHDEDVDQDVDLGDFRGFQTALTGP